MLGKKVLLVAMGLMGTTLNASIAQDVDNLTVQRPPKPLSPRPGHMPPPTRPAPPLPSAAPSEEAPLSLEPSGQVPSGNPSKGTSSIKQWVSRKTQNLFPKNQPEKREGADLTIKMDTRTQDAVFLGKISEKLLQMTKQNCNTLITQTRSKIDNIPPKPEGYKGAYQSKKDVEFTLDQANVSFTDLEKRVKEQIKNAQNPEGKKDLIRIFEDIFGDIDLNGRKNCEKYTTSLNSILDDQRNKILTFQPKTSKLQRVTQGVKRIVTGKKKEN